MTEHTVPQRLHEGMHRLPGVPSHSEAGTRNHRRGLPNRPLRGRSLKGAHGNHPRAMKEARVLVGWQNAIARLFSRTDG
ncbi:hypothetical protein SAMN04487846_0609 [Microbacterium sp. cf046]|uniref:hypothetical protein n=1 Tax=Microbacterium sp. cf046 TaxID=1761803 RepID=UPI0008EA5CD6|nr:hypothetical protein [Microbacterium sp. cf046]SFR92145.1 hypothetical protein SAMN04487846_0609 [Microbacterium sp. cf046]